MSATPVTAVRMLLTLTVLTGIAYPLAVTGLARVTFPARAHGSLLRMDDRVIGSALIGQSFESAGYFWGRLSATGPVPYNAAASSGSNYGPLHPSLAAAATARAAALRAGGATGALPVDLLTASGSGLDPHISPAAALAQVSRVAAARGVAADPIRALVASRVEPRTLGVLGEPRVNVLLLNLALDSLAAAP